MLWVQNRVSPILRLGRLCVSPLGMVFISCFVIHCFFCFSQSLQSFSCGESFPQLLGCIDVHSIVLRILTNLSWIFSRSWTFFTGHNLVHRCMKSQSRMDQWLSFGGKFTPFGLQSEIVNSVELIEKLSGTL